MSEQIHELIDRYFDNELDKASEGSLFSVLSVNNEAREYFKSLLLLRNIAETDKALFPEKLDERILGSLRTQSTKKDQQKMTWRASLQYLGYGISVVLIIVMSLIYTEFKDYQEKVSKLDERLRQQNHTIEMLYNSLPPVTIRPTMNN